jgi:hypothetical protein
VTHVSLIFMLLEGVTKLFRSWAKPNINRIAGDAN